MKPQILLIAVMLMFSKLSFSQRLSLSGYFSDLHSISIDSADGNWTNDNLIHNRLNFRYYGKSYFSAGTDLRNRIFTGETVKYFPAYADFIGRDKGLVDLSFNLAEEKSFIFNSQIDRLWLTFEKGDWNITAGRQRINWGRSFVWNPNDVFNNYSFFDIDYPERPGSDALRVQYYTGSTSSAELVVKTDSTQKLTAAGMYRFSFKNFDWQVLGGVLSEQDYFAGIGWEGYLQSFALRGELTYLQPKENFADTSGVLLSSISTDYFFSNSLQIQAEFLYNHLPAKADIASFEQIMYQALSVKNLSFTEYNIFASINYPLTPIWTLSLSGMYYPKIKGFFVGPSIAYSLSNNADFSLIGQSFSGELSPQAGQQTVSLIYLRLKINF